MTFGGNLAGVITTDQDIKDARSAADARALAADGKLNRLALRLKVAIHGAKQVDVSNPKHQLYFGNKTVAEAIRPVLGSQLELSNSWVEDLLPKETDPAFTALLLPMTEGVKEGNAAKDAVKTARTANSTFRLVGARRQIFEEYNALTAETLGALVAYRAAHPELELSPDWPASFFLHVTVDPGPQTVEEVDDLLAELAVKQQKLQEKRTELEKADADAAVARTNAAQAATEYETKKQARVQSRKDEKAAAAKLKEAQKAARKAAKKRK